MKIIFLDVDGVLNSQLYYKKAYKPYKGRSRLDPFAVLLVKKLIEEFSLKIVLPSI